jgi:hypothetical protein
MLAPRTVQFSGYVIASRSERRSNPHLVGRRLLGLLTDRDGYVSVTGNLRTYED